VNDYDLPFDTAQVREFGIANASDVRQSPSYLGQPVYIPARNRAVSADPKRPTLLISAVDANGRPIPGTLVIRDIYERGPGGVSELRWDAGAALRHWLGKDGKSGDWAKQGLFAFKVGTDPRRSPDFQRAEREFKKRRYIYCQQVVTSELARRELFKKTGKVAPPAGSGFHDAIAFLETYTPETEQSVGAFKCLVCGTTKTTYKQFEIHGKRIHPDESIAKILKVDKELAAEQDPTWLEADDLSKRPLPGGRGEVGEVVDETPSDAPPLVDAPAPRPLRVAPPEAVSDALTADLSDEDLEKLTRPSGDDPLA
jgi:hypothetical protein